MIDDTLLTPKLDHSLLGKQFEKKLYNLEVG